MKKNKRRVNKITQRQVIGAMAVSIGLLSVIFIWSFAGAILDSTSGIAVVDTLSDIGLFNKKASISVAAGGEQESTLKQTLTAEESTEAAAEESVDPETGDESTTCSANQSEEDDMHEESIYSRINTATIANQASNVKDVVSLEAVDAETVKSWINEYSIGDYKYLGGEEMTEEAKAAVESRRNLEGITQTAEPQFGVITENAAVRGYPTWQALSNGLGEHDFDYFQESMFLTGEPVAIYHSTADGIWSFVQGTNYRGWVESDHIALCSRDELKNWLADENFVVTDAYITVSDVTLRMGTSIHGEAQADGDVILTLPARGESGELEEKKMTVSGGEGLNEGYLEMNTEAILKQAKLLLGTPYGWGDSNGDMDCSSTMNSIYRCFGVILPRNTSELAATGTEVTSLEGMSAEEKLEYIKTREPGTILLMKGHVVMYIGEVDQTESILHNFVGYSTDGGQTKIDTYVCSITPIDITSTSGTSYLERYEYTISFSQWYE